MRHVPETFFFYEPVNVGVTFSDTRNLNLGKLKHVLASMIHV